MILVNGEVVEEFDFPDSQPHVKLKRLNASRAHVKMRIANANDLLKLMLVNDCLNYADLAVKTLEITYLLGARMDRRINEPGLVQPDTLNAICEVINSCGFNAIDILDPHSYVAVSSLKAFSISPEPYVKKAIHLMPGLDSKLLIAPDGGAGPRVRNIARNLDKEVAYCSKLRNPVNGKLSGFEVQTSSVDKVKGKNCLIVDDICDGGGTFIGIANELYKAGANSVSLYVTHGIMSKGLEALTGAGVNHIYTTNSYKVLCSTNELTVFNVW